MWTRYCIFFLFQAEDGIRDLVRSRGLGDVYKRQLFWSCSRENWLTVVAMRSCLRVAKLISSFGINRRCLLYTSDAADERSSVDLGGRRIIKKKNTIDAIAVGGTVV